MVRAITSTVGWRRGCRTWSYRYPSTRRSPLCQPLPSWGSWPLTPGAVSCTSTSQFSLPRWAHILHIHIHMYTHVRDTCDFQLIFIYIVWTLLGCFCRKECAVDMCCACAMCMCVCVEIIIPILIHKIMFVTCQCLSLVKISWMHTCMCMYVYMCSVFVFCHLQNLPDLSK